MPKRKAVRNMSTRKRRQVLRVRYPKIISCRRIPSCYHSEPKKKRKGRKARFAFFDCISDKRNAKVRNAFLDGEEEVEESVIWINLPRVVVKPCADQYSAGHFRACCMRTNPPLRSFITEPRSRLIISPLALKLVKFLLNPARKPQNINLASIETKGKRESFFRSQF